MKTKVSAGMLGAVLAVAACGEQLPTDVPDDESAGESGQGGSSAGAGPSGGTGGVQAGSSSVTGGESGTTSSGGAQIGGVSGLSSGGTGLVQTGGSFPTGGSSIGGSLQTGGALPTGGSNTGGTSASGSAGVGGTGGNVGGAGSGGSVGRERCPVPIVDCTTMQFASCAELSHNCSICDVDAYTCGDTSIFHVYRATDGQSFRCGPSESSSECTTARNNAILHCCPQ